MTERHSHGRSIRAKAGRPKHTLRKPPHQREKKPRPRMKPEADPLLKPLFAKIGKPVAAGFKPDPFQLDALEAIRREDCLVMGKNLVSPLRVGNPSNTDLLLSCARGY